MFDCFFKKNICNKRKGKERDGNLDWLRNRRGDESEGDLRVWLCFLIFYGYVNMEICMGLGFFL